MLLLLPCILPTLLTDLPNLGFFAMPPRGAALLAAALRFALLLGCRGLPLVLELVDLSRLIAAMAEPLLSCLACTVRASSWCSASHKDSQAWTSLDRPRERRGISGLTLDTGSWLVRTEMGGRVTEDDDALWLR